jgi:hypothetical protein
MLVGTVHFTFKDAKGKESFTKIRIPSTFTFAQYKLFGAAAAQVFANMSTAEITEVSVGVGIDLSGLGLNSVAAQFADWFNKAFIQANNAISGLIAKFNLPTYDDSHNTAGSKTLDPTDTDVIALTTLITDGVTVGGSLVFPVTVRDEALSTVTIAKETFRKS